MNIANTNNSISEDDIGKLEEGLNVKLPSEYKKFLLLYNGGKPVNHIFTGSLELGYLVVNELYGINAKHKYNDLYHMIDIYDGRIPIEFIPIGGDPGGNQFCLGVSGDYFGKIYFWDHEEEDDDNNKIGVDNKLPSNMYFLLNGFTSFISQLVEE